MIYVWAPAGAHTEETRTWCLREGKPKLCMALGAAGFCTIANKLGHFIALMEYSMAV
jgi:hypothetical protein